MRQSRQEAQLVSPTIRSTVSAALRSCDMGESRVSGAGLRIPESRICWRKLDWGSYSRESGLESWVGPIAIRFRQLIEFLIRFSYPAISTTDCFCLRLTAAVDTLRLFLKGKHVKNGNMRKGE